MQESVDITEHSSSSQSSVDMNTNPAAASETMDDKQSHLEKRVDSLEGVMLEINVFLARLSAEILGLKMPRRGTSSLGTPLTLECHQATPTPGRIRAKQHPDPEQETIIESFTFGHQSPQKSSMTLSSSSSSSTSDTEIHQMFSTPSGRIPFYRGERDAEVIWAWLDRVEAYFKLGQVAEDEKIFIATYHLRDSAYFWWRSCAKAMNPETWEEFVRLFVPTFVPPNHLRETKFALMDLRQLDSVRDYSSQFFRLISRLPQLSQDDQVAFFVHGLKCSIRAEVDEHNPRSLNEAIRVAHIAEARKFTW